MQETQKNPEAVEKRITTASPFTRLAPDLSAEMLDAEPRTIEPHCVMTARQRHAAADDVLDFAIAERQRQQLDRIEAKVGRCEAILMQLVATLADDGEEELPGATLDGDTDGGERDQSQSLG